MFEQIIIAVTGGIAIWLANDSNEKYRKYACLVGLAGQPFWLHVTFSVEMAGMFMVSALYTVAWFRGAWNFWIKPYIDGIPHTTSKSDPEQDWL